MEGKVRVAIVGTSGSGKSTFAGRLSTRLGVPHIELDAINWRPGWRALSQDDPPAFRAEVAAAVVAPAWTCDGNYSVAQPLVLARATHLVWLDYPRALIMRRVLRRSLTRALSRRELWAGSGNREEFRRWLDRDHPIRWAWDTFEARRARYQALFKELKPSGKILVRLTRPRQAEVLIAALAAGGL